MSAYDLALFGQLYLIGIHILGVYPKHKLVMVHRVDTEHSYRFNDGDLYRVIRMIHAARLPATPAD